MIVYMNGNNVMTEALNACGRYFASGDPKGRA